MADAVPPAEPATDAWLHRDVRVDVSRIAGRGLFATTLLPAGTVVSRFGGQLISKSEFDAQTRDETHYVDGVAVDADVFLLLPPGTANRYVNHSCDPNLGWTDAYTLTALRDIAAGVELSFDYATGVADPAFTLWCHCETYRCRQVIEGTDWQIPQLQRRYAGHWTPYLQRLIDTGVRQPG